jgi:uncharacterized caspase-like protein
MRSALITGINAYAGANALSGCVADAQWWTEYLTNRKFKARLMTDQEATRSNMLAATQELVLTAKAGDKLVWGYSGHGTQLPDLDGDEGDAYDEAICPVDFDRGNFIIDDDLRAIFDKLPAGVTLTCFLDSCYSGTATRLLGVNATRMGAVPERPRYLRPTREQEQRYKDIRAAEGYRPAVVAPEQMRHATLSACTPQEVAWETGGQGVFTKAALEVLEKSGPTLTLSGLLNRIIKSMGPDRWQTPTLDSPERMRGQTIVRKA